MFQDPYIIVMKPEFLYKKSLAAVYISKPLKKFKLSKETLTQSKH